jgi:predicted acyl esterase
MIIKNTRTYGLLLTMVVSCLMFAARIQTQTLPSESPQELKPTNYGLEYERREVMIPMRDGVKLHTVIIVPKSVIDAKKKAPMLLTRTPYNATELTSHAASSHLGPILNGYDNALEVIVEGGYIRVVQDVRGKYGSEVIM